MQTDPEVPHLVHALREQLNVIHLTCEVIERLPGPPGRPDPRLAQVREAVDRAVATLEELVATVSPEVPEFPPRKVPAVEPLTG